MVYRAGFARTRRPAVSSSATPFRVNGQRVTIPSYQVSQYDIIDLRDKSQNLTPLVIARETHGERDVPGWMDVDIYRGRILIHQLPVREQIVIDVQEHLIVEYYSRR